ncbi:ATP-binding protein [Rhizosaccharibacter radicis]|uniref:histidine kinase n=1 Tax=Rhizosaccharibacter radicis TaxID=2782605 RepID=A0ABT1W2V7_9PROT|nr:ATP-binding protein [Acetobacteraceae bacterium KSS12]
MTDAPFSPAPDGPDDPARAGRRRRWHLLPRSLAARTALVLLCGLVVVQTVGLAIHAMDRISFARIDLQRDMGIRVSSIYRMVAEVPPAQRVAQMAQLHLPPGFKARLGPEPLLGNFHLASPPLQRMIRGRVQFMPMPEWLRPREVVVGVRPAGRRYGVAIALPDEDRWLTVFFVMPFADPFLSPTLPVAFLLMTVTAGVLSIWAVRRLTRPLRVLATAAEQLGRDVHAPPLPEDGPLEVATAAVAFNTMATRIRRFVNDRTLLLTAIGHDLRTPITRLKLRAEFIEDEELAAKFLADLDELEAMVSATLAFGRDSAAREPMARLDLTALLRTILDEISDMHPELAEQLVFASPPPSVIVQARPIALKRALSNLVANAAKYGGGARVTMSPPRAGHVAVLIEDDGPGLPPDALERMFEPFVRMEDSRNRETGGTGLGLSIARNIVRGHGGDITLSNRLPHGLRATVMLAG